LQGLYRVGRRSLIPLADFVKMQAPTMQVRAGLLVKPPTATLLRLHTPANQCRVHSLRKVSQRHSTITAVAALESPATETGSAASTLEPIAFEEVGLRRSTYANSAIRTVL